MNHNVYCDLVVHGSQFIKNNFLMTDHSFLKNFKKNLYYTSILYSITEVPTA